MANHPQLWIKRMALTVDGSRVALPFPSDDPPEVTTVRFADAPQIVPGSIRRFQVNLDTATAVGDWTFTVVKNGVDTDLTLTIPQGSTTIGATADIDRVTFDQYDFLCIREEASTGSATAKPWTFTLEFTPTVSGHRAYGGGHMNFLGDSVDPSGVFKQNPFFPRTQTWGDRTLDEYKPESCLIGQDGTITEYLIYYQIEMTSGSYEFMLWRSTDDGATFIPQDGTGGTVDTRITMDATSPLLPDTEANGRTYAHATFSLPVNQGDLVYITADRTSGDTFPIDSVGLRGLSMLAFIADDASKWFIAGSSTGLGTVFTNYIAPLGDRTVVDSSTVTTGIHIGPFGQEGALFAGLYVLLEGAPGTGNDRTFELYNAGIVTDVVTVISGTNVKADDDGTALVATGDTVYIKHIPNGVPDDNVRFWYTFFGTSDVERDGIIGPLAWVHWPRRIPGSPSETITDTYSDMDMQCPAEWENGFKEGLVTRWGDSERPSSHLFTGEWQGSTFSFQIADKGGRFRAQQGSLVDRYWNDALTVRMTTRANRALLGPAFTVFSGPIIEAQPTAPLLWDVTLGDVVSHGLLSDRFQVPWRVVRDSFLNDLTAISDTLDRDTPEPIIYGEHSRLSGEETSPASDAGHMVTPIYLGIDTIDAIDHHVWLVCGHAVKDLEIFVDGVHQIEFPVFSTWLIPHHSEHQAEFGAPYEDRVSDTLGTIRRYTIVYGNVGRAGPDACAAGESVLSAAVWGIETEGDGTGELITDRFDQYQHFLINYIANQGPQSYQSGPWLDNPTWDIIDGPVTKVNEESFAIAKAIGEERLVGGYIGAAAIGIRGDRSSAKKWIADWNRSCACRFAINADGQMHIFLLHPTEAIKAAAPLYTDAYDILDGSFATELKWDEHATSITFVADFDPVTGGWKTNGVASDPEAIENYGRDIPSETREYPFAPGIEQSTHLANLELGIRKHRPRYIRLDATIGHDPVTGDSLGYRDQGAYIRYVSYDAIQSDEMSPSGNRQERLAQVITPIIRVDGRRAAVVAMDCEDLIDYDVESSP